MNPWPATKAATNQKIKMANTRNINGFECYYSPSEDQESDCSKIWHDFRRVDNNEFVKSMDFSPYNSPSVIDVDRWIELGCPDRKTLAHAGGVGPMTSKEIQTAWVALKSRSVAGLERLAQIEVEEKFYQ